MLPYFWYLLKVIICSGILFGYYWLFLRNKIFHQYNRFYLLAAMSLSLLLPLLKINFWQPAVQQNQAIRVLQAVSAGDEYMNSIVISTRQSNWSFEQVYPMIYWLVSFIFLIVMLRTIFLIRTLLKKYAVQQVEEFAFVNTEDDSTPFSFLKYIFWNSSIDINTTTGRQIFKHEVAHIQEKHTHDKLFVNIVLIFCWCNPFFWLYRKELNMIHEFIADKKAVENSDTAAFAAMILQAAYPRHRFELVNNFFYSPIKRRLLMLTKNNNPKLSYITRLMVLPLAVLVFAAFTFKAKNNNTSIYQGKKITVVIDAGHGGKDLGATGTDGIYEKDLTLAIAKKVQELNSNDAIEIVLTRDGDVYMDAQQKVAFAKNKKADIVISFHIDNGPKETANKHTGISFWVAKDEFPNAGQSKVLASAIVNEFSSNYGLPVMYQINQRQSGVWILQANTCPAVLIEAGFINNDKDLAYLQTTAAKEAIAKNVLTAIEKFANSKVQGNTTKNQLSQNDTFPSGMFINVKHADADYLKSDEFKTKALVIVDSKEIGNVGNNYVERSTEKYSTVVIYNSKEAQLKFGVKGKYGVIKLTQKDAIFDGSIKLSGTGSPLKGDLSNSLIYLEDKIISPEELNQIPPAKISSVSILKGDKIDDIVDAKGKTSVIYVSLKAEDLPEVIVVGSAKANSDTTPLELKQKLVEEQQAKILQEYSQNQLKLSAADLLNDKVIEERKMTEKQLLELKQKLILEEHNKAKLNYALREKLVVGQKLNNQQILNEKQKLIVEQQAAAKLNYALKEKLVVGQKLNDLQIFEEKQKLMAEQLVATKLNADLYEARANDLELSVKQQKELQAQQNNIVFTQAETKPQFTGGQAAWVKYMQANLKINALVDKGAKAGRYTVVLKFMVNADGSLSDITCENDPGFGACAEAIRFIKATPKWQPAIQNGKKINAYLKQPITFIIADATSSLHNIKNTKEPILLFATAQPYKDFISMPATLASTKPVALVLKVTQANTNKVCSNITVQK